jgi:hypothetical protein
MFSETIDLITMLTCINYRLFHSQKGVDAYGMDDHVYPLVSQLFVMAKAVLMLL